MTNLFNAQTAQEIKALLKNGANVNNGIRGSYPLYIAVLKNDLKMFNILMAANADVNIGFLTFYGHIIHYVCCTGYCDIFDRMVELNCDLEITGFFDETPLITACMSEQIDIVDRLLALDCNVNAYDENGKSAFLHAVETGNLDILNKLIVYGANMTHIDNDGNNALYYANLNGGQKIIDYISSFNCF